MIIKDAYSTYTWVKVFRNKDDATESFKEFLANVRTDGEVEIVRSDGGGEFRGKFSQVCVDNRMKQEFTTPTPLNTTAWQSEI